MVKEHAIKKFLLLILHKLARYTKQQKLFVLYLLVLTFFMLVLPVIKVSPADPDLPSRLVFLLSGAMGKTTLILLLSLLVLLGWNMSFRFKNFITAYFGFKDNESLFNFWFLWLITSIYVALSDTIWLFTETTSLQVTRWGYNFVLLLLIVGLVLTLISIVKKARSASHTKIVNIMDEQHDERAEKAKATVRGLFGEEE